MKAGDLHIGDCIMHPIWEDEIWEIAGIKRGKNRIIILDLRSLEKPGKEPCRVALWPEDNIKVPTESEIDMKKLML